MAINRDQPLHLGKVQRVVEQRRGLIVIKRVAADIKLFQAPPRSRGGVGLDRRLIGYFTARVRRAVTVVLTDLVKRPDQHQLRTRRDLTSRVQKIMLASAVRQRFAAAVDFQEGVLTSDEG